MINIVKKIDKSFYHLSYWLIVLLVSIVFILLFGGVVGRYIFSFTPFFLEELSRYLLIWIGAISANIAIRKGEFMVIDVFLDKIPQGARIVIFRLISFIAFIFLLFLLYVSFKHSMGLRTNSSSTLPISMMWPTLAIPVGVILMIPHYFLSFLIPQDEEEKE